MLSQEYPPKEQQEKINNSTRECIIYRFDIEETQGYIKDKMGIELPIGNNFKNYQ